ncbi:tripartite motif-containing protein 2-like [Littorina saxatilis]|uniref:tripartite motif-containing protein 2-like n=1 Tax=Littorina saxatilis TaxID=31220 RepID=UPI0038B54CD8
MATGGRDVVRRHLGEPSEEKDIHATASVSIVCPTCRRSTPIPSGGVERLQNNIYVNAGNDENDPPPILCDLCEEGQEAKYNCTKCVSYFCTRCTRSHNRFCQASAVKELKTSKASTTSSKTPANAPRDECQLLQDVIHKLVEKEKRLGEERRAREHDVHVRYAALLRHAGEARDVSLGSLREVTQVLGDVIRADLSLARDALNKMKQSSAGDEAVSVTSKKVLSEENRRHFEELLNQKEDLSILKYEQRDNTENLHSSLRDFMGTIVAPSNDSAEDFDASRHLNASNSLQQGKGLLPSQGSKLSLQNVDATDMEAKLETLAAKVAESEKQISLLQTQNTLLCRDFTARHNDNTKLSTDVEALFKELCCLKETSSKTTKDVTTLQHDKANIAEKCQKNQQLRDELTSLQAEHNKTATNVGEMKQSIGDLLKDKVAKGNPQVAFHARMNDETVVKQFLETVICGTVITNAGGAYDDKTGIFKAPVSGFYCFLATSRSADADDDSICDPPPRNESHVTSRGSALGII